MKNTRTRPLRRLGIYSLGFFKDRRIATVLKAAGWEIRFGPLTQHLDAIAVWGDRPVAKRGLKAAKRRGLPVLYVEDAFIRSVGENRNWPLAGLTIDQSGNYVDCSRPSDLETLLNKQASVDPETEAALEAFIRSDLSKFNERSSEPEPLEGDYVLVVDQVRGDASIRLGGANEASFARMLDAAIAENPGKRVLVRRHPKAEEDAGLSHFEDGELPERVKFMPFGISVSQALNRASRVYCVTSQLGFEAIMRDHRPRVFGGAFYAGWGLSDDEMELSQRRATHTKQSLFQRVMLEYPVWFDPFRERVCDLNEIVSILEAQRRNARLKRKKWTAVGMRLWKRASIKDFLGDVKFVDKPPSGDARDLVVWGSLAIEQNRETPILRLEDGFLRSAGLGAELTPALSYSLDDLGIYYDPSSPSRLERMIAASIDCSDSEIRRAVRLRKRIVSMGLSKYNVGAVLQIEPDKRPTILVAGQVEDDASIIKGAVGIKTNLDLLREARRQNPDARILYKPHPDVEAGLRIGLIGENDLGKLCDRVLRDVSASQALEVCDEVWCITSLIGFEALLREKSVTCLGHPFYAGWGLTTDHAGPVARRSVKVSLDQLVHATLIDYPHYRDPVTGLPCPVEVTVERLIEGFTQKGPINKTLAKFQGAFASYASLWR